MPFTFAHPAAVLPFKYLPKRCTSLTGLVIGSMAPDFEKFLSMEGGNSYSHTWGAIFWFCLPLGIMLSFVFHLVVRDPLIDNLPGFMRRRVARFKKLDWKVHFTEHYFIIITSIIIGATTHIIWDGFTHKNGPGENQLALLGEHTSLSVFSVPLFYFLNLLSSAIGVVVVLYAIMRLPAEPVVAEKSKRTKAYWPLVVFLMLAIVGIRFSAGLNLEEVMGVKGDFWNLIIAIVAASLISLLIAPIFLKLLFFNRGS
ncbi:DUF4184 family protein [Pontibacter toksunensis]|uniref:DUF4184 family protein n=1 Tax=Pontibacter toksunensis TaxID=1332631 RepID=A0ABW6BZI6_9BACT